MIRKKQYQEEMEKQNRNEPNNVATSAMHDIDFTITNQKISEDQDYNSLTGGEKYVGPNKTFTKNPLDTGPISFSGRNLGLSKTKLGMI